MTICQCILNKVWVLNVVAPNGIVLHERGLLGLSVSNVSGLFLTEEGTIEGSWVGLFHYTAYTNWRVESLSSD